MAQYIRSFAFHNIRERDEALRLLAYLREKTRLPQGVLIVNGLKKLKQEVDGDKTEMSVRV